MAYSASVLTVISATMLSQLDHMGIMRTAPECVAKAIEMEVRAAAAKTATVRLSYVQLGICWRELACVIASLTGQPAFKPTEVPLASSRPHDPKQPSVSMAPTSLTAHFTRLRQLCRP